MDWRKFIEFQVVNNTDREGPGPWALSTDDIESFHDAADHRKGPLTQDQIISVLKLRNWVRWHRLQSDFKWLQKQYKKMGLNPDDARYLL